MELEEKKQELLKKVYKIMHNNVAQNLTEKEMKKMFFTEKFGKKVKAISNEEYINNLEEYINDYERLEKILEDYDAKNN